MVRDFRTARPSFLDGRFSFASSTPVCHGSRLLFLLILLLFSSVLLLGWRQRGAKRSEAKRVEWLLWRDRCGVWGALLSACAWESAHCMQAGFDGIEWLACCRKAMGSSSFSSLGGYSYNDPNSTPHPTNPAVPMIHSRVEQKCLIRLKN